MRCLEVAVCEISCELKTPRDVVRVFLRYAAPFELDRDSQKIFTSGSNSVSPLRVRPISTSKMLSRIESRLFALIVRGYCHEQESPQNRPEGSLCFR